MSHSMLCPLVIICFVIHCNQSVTIPLDNTTYHRVWNVDIPLFGETTSGAFGLENGATVSIDISTLKLIDDTFNNCSHIEDLFHLDIYILNSDQYESIASTDYDANYCHDEFSSQFQIQNCWYFTLAAQKYAIPINGTYKSSHTIAEGDYYVFVVNPCNITYQISGSISLQNPWTSF